MTKYGKIKQCCSNFHKCIAALKLTVWCIDIIVHTTQTTPQHVIFCCIYVVNSIRNCECIFKTRAIGMETRDEKQIDLKLPTITFIHEVETETLVCKLFTMHKDFSFLQTCAALLQSTIIHKQEWILKCCTKCIFSPHNEEQRVWVAR